MELISRQAAIKAIEEEWDGCCSEYPATQIIYDTTEAIEKLPSIQPKRGKWIKISPANIYECSECGKSVMTNDICAYDFCHGCGADMREVTL